jgi:NAD(P)-dependent dehydrogenase (short-subunit alcohol dehydrogenase family)
VSSILGIYPGPTVSAYVASKFAVRGLSLSLRAELAEHRIGVTAICPGMIATDIVEAGRVSPDLRARRPAMADLFRKRGARPELVAAAIVESVHANPAVRTVGRDARVLAALMRVVPGAAQRLGARLQRRYRAP